MPNRTKEFINQLFTESQLPCIELIGPCQECKTEVRVIIFKSELDSPEGNGGMIVGPNDDDLPQFKCSECLAKDGNKISPTVCEVFSRVCGYLRPIKGWNKGKKAEKLMRVNYKMD
jgi:hypothetical protein